MENIISELPIVPNTTLYSNMISNTFDKYILPHELWVPVIDIDIDSEKYWVSNYGRVYSVLSNIIMSQKCDKGYMRLTIQGKTKNVHRLVLQSFCPVPDYHLLQVNHIDCNKSNNMLYNLEWVTAQQNTIHAYNNNLIKIRYGTDNHACTLTDEQVHLICELLSKSSITMNDIAEYVGTSYTIVKNISIGLSHTKISSLYEFPRKHSQYLSDETVHMICNIVSRNRNLSISDVYSYISMYNQNVTRRQIGMLMRGETYNHISKQYNIF